MKKKYAFISYSHSDMKIAKWLHKKLESYKLPIGIQNEFGKSKYLRPIFRDQEDLDSGVLSDELIKHLESSKFLIVIISSNSAKSNWVDNEVRAFIKMGRWKYIIPFIVDNIQPDNDYNTCFPSSLCEYVSEHPDKELLSINIFDCGREKAFVRVVSRMLDVSFDELWKRHEREFKHRVLMISIFTPIILSLIYYLAVPITLSIELKDDNHCLPLPEDATLIINTTEYSVVALDTVITIANIPGYYRGKKLPINFLAQWYNCINESIVIGWGTKCFYQINLLRDNSFSDFSGKVIDVKGRPIVNAKLCMEDLVTYTDSMGHFMFTLPLEKQAEMKAIRIIKDGYEDYYREDEVPNNNLIYILKAKV